MIRISIEDNWKDSWKYCYPYDLLEIYGETKANTGYAYAYENRRKNTFSLIKSVSKPGDEILDVAAAQGNFTLALAELGYKVTWNDIREELVDYVKMKYEKGEVDYKPGNVFEVDFKKKFDIILATEIIEHVAHPDEFLLNLSNLLKPGGHIVISTPLGSYFKNDLPKFSEFKNPEIFESVQFKPNSDGHIFLLHSDEFPTLAKRAGLEIIKFVTFTNSLTNGHLKLEPLLKVISKKAVFYLDACTQKLPASISNKILTGCAVLFKKAQ